MIVDHGGRGFLERAGTDERISAGSALRKSFRQRSIPGSVQTTRARVFFVTSAFIGCRVQIVRKGAKDLGNARPVGTKLLDLPAELLVVPLQGGHQGLKLVLLLGRLCELVDEPLSILEPASDFCGEV
jgi:hypothetical protein